MSEELNNQLELAEQVFKKTFKNDSIAWNILKMAQAFVDNYEELERTRAQPTGTECAEALEAFKRLCGYMKSYEGFDEAFQCEKDIGEVLEALSRPQVDIESLRKPEIKLNKNYSNYGEMKEVKIYNTALDDVKKTYGG